MVELRGIEGPAHRPRTSAVHRRVSSVLLALIATPAVSGGATRDRTADLLNANQALSQLSYSPNAEDRGRKTEDRLSRAGGYSCALPVAPVGFLSSVLCLLSSELVGLGRFELPTSPLSGVRSNQLSYRPMTLYPGQSRRGRRSYKHTPAHVHGIKPFQTKTDV